MTPVLKKSYKKQYPFRLGTTSFIYADHYLPNIKKLGPFLDEIELLVFESRDYKKTLTRSIIAELVELSATLDFSYNIHLPINLFLGDHDPSKRSMAVATFKNIIDWVAPLNPTTYTLHLERQFDLDQPAEFKIWKQRTFDSLRRLLDLGVDSQSLSVETLDYPITWIDKIIRELDLRVCIDMGHLFFHGFDFKQVIDLYLPLTTIIHLHGVTKNSDHLALDKLSPKKAALAAAVLNNFHETLSLEIFNYEDLDKSLATLETWPLKIRNEFAL